MSAQSDRAVGEGPFEPEDFAYVAKELRKYSDIKEIGYSRVLLKSIDMNIILAALDAQSEDLSP